VASNKPAKKAATKKAVAAKKALPTPTMAGRNYFKQSEFPLVSLQQAQKIAAAIVDNFAGEGGSPPDVALAIGISPTSSAWPSLAGASIAYGLTAGGVNANAMTITDLGKKLVAPEEEGADITARREAIMKPRLMKEFFEKYRRAKFPNEIIGANVLKAQGIPVDRVENALQIIKENGKYAGVIRDTPTGPFINLDSPGVPAPTATPALPEDDQHDEQPAGAGQAAPLPPKPVPPSAAFDPKADHVFISHGKQRAIVTQIKELLEFGKFTPVVSVEREATAISVPEKVFEDMRSCAAGIIHVGGEGKYLDPDGNEHTKLNDNVLIEIGAAMALYGKKIILLVEKGVALPSNLQGLYRCEFEGDKLEYDSTMKLLKTFSQFR
jgi:Predicted nucleotide-binding protein containing TIR-like domain